MSAQAGLTQQTAKVLHPFCNRCGWRKGGVDSWDGERCKCGHAAEPMPADDANLVVSRHHFDHVTALFCKDGSTGLAGIVTAVLPEGVHLIGNGTCPHPLDVRLSAEREKRHDAYPKLVKALRLLRELAAMQRATLRFDKTPVESDAEALLRDLGEEA